MSIDNPPPATPDVPGVPQVPADPTSPEPGAPTPDEPVLPLDDADSPDRLEMPDELIGDDGVPTADWLPENSPPDEPGIVT